MLPHSTWCCSQMKQDISKYSSESRYKIEAKKFMRIARKNKDSSSRENCEKKDGLTNESEAEIEKLF